MSTFFCTYCGKDKDISERTDEHVLPRKLGGGVSSQNPFLLRTVCKSCNSTCGLFVDAPFAKNTFVHSALSLKNRKYLSVEKSNFPLNFMGRLKPIRFIPEGLTCDLWLGPTGDSVYHFHKPYPVISGTLGMITPAVVRGMDPGFVISFVRSNNPVWHPAIIRSILDGFREETKFYFPTITFSGTLPNNILTPDKETAALIATLMAHIQTDEGKSAQLEFSIDLGFSERFQAKTALGFGALFLKPEYQQSSYAQELRDFLWTKNNEDREAFMLRGTSYFNDEGRPITKLMGADHGISILIQPSGKGIGLYVNFYKDKDYFMLISDDMSNWPEDLDDTGIALIVAPGIKKAVGPLPVIEYISANTGNNLVSPFRKLQEEAEAAVQPLPPFDI